MKAPIEKAEIFKRKTLKQTQGHFVSTILNRINQNADDDFGWLTKHRTLLLATLYCSIRNDSNCQRDGFSKTRKLREKKNRIFRRVAISYKCRLWKFRKSLRELFQFWIGDEQNVECVPWRMSMHSASKYNRTNAGSTFDNLHLDFNFRRYATIKTRFNPKKLMPYSFEHIFVLSINLDLNKRC